MKKISIFLLSISVGLILFSCGGVTQTKELVSESSDKQNQIKVSGSRSNSFDPFRVNVVINGYGKSDTLTIAEMHATNLTKDNVLFSWTDNNTCLMTFIEQDDVKRGVGVRFSAEGNSWNETAAQ